MARRQFRVLHREFLFRIVDRELLSTYAQGDMSRLLLQIVALLISLSLMCSIGALPFESNTMHPLVRHLAAWSMEHFLIATTMLIVGLFAVLSWSSMFPDRTDVQVLGPLPVRGRTMFLAKVAALATALGLTVVSLHVATGLAWPLALNVRTPPQPMLAMTFDAARPPVGAAGLKAVLDEDLAGVLRTGALAPGAGGGITIGVYTKGERRIFAYGAATPDSMFETGSATKTFTGLLLAYLAHQGTVRLDEPVRELLPEADLRQPSGPEITLVDLATHRSGLPRMDTGFRASNPGNPFAHYDAARLKTFLSIRGVGKAPSPPMRYSNIGFGLLGHALAARADVDYLTLVRDVITDPLGMRDTVAVLSPEQRGRFLQGYNLDRQPVQPFDLDVLIGAGGFRSTADDMLRWLEANLHPERLGAAPLAAALSASHEPRASLGPHASIALAWFFDSRTGTYLHGGATAGGTADAFFNPRDDSAAIVLSNSGPSAIVSADVLGQHIRSRLAGEPAMSIMAVVIPPAGGVSGALRLFGAFWITMIAAGVFIFCLVMGVQGVAAHLLPRRYFLRVSSYLQLGAFAVIVAVYFLQPMGAGPPAIVATQQPGWMAWSPSFWFLGLFQQLNGSPALASLASRARWGLAVVIGLTVVAYALSYVRTLHRIAEEQGIAPGTRFAGWLPSFGNGRQTAVVQFSIRTMLRSAQARVILAFYLGIGFAIAILFLKAPAVQQLSTVDSGASWQEISIPMLAATIFMLGFSVLGARTAFGIPHDLRANWIFRIMPLRGGPEQVAAVRRSLLVLAVAPVWLVSALSLLPMMWLWQATMGHLIVLALLGTILAELCLHGTQKIPFTCSYLPGKSTIHMTFWLGIMFLIPLTMWAVSFERGALYDPTRYAAMLAVLGLAWGWARWRTGWLTAAAGEADPQPQFDETPADRVTTLELWDSIRASQRAS